MMREVKVLDFPKTIEIGMLFCWYPLGLLIESTKELDCFVVALAAGRKGERRQQLVNVKTGGVWASIPRPSEAQLKKDGFRYLGMAEKLVRIKIPTQKVKE